MSRNVRYISLESKPIFKFKKLFFGGVEGDVFGVKVKFDSVEDLEFFEKCMFNVFEEAVKLGERGVADDE